MDTALGYTVHLPSPPLAGLVDYFWSLSDAPAHARECIVPSGTLEVVINLHDDEFCIHKPASLGADGVSFPGAVASGAYGRAFVVETRAHASIIGVHFKPAGAATILGLPAGELANQHVELEALWGRRARELRERLCAAAHLTQRFQLFEQALIDCLSRCKGVRGEIAVALDRLGEPSAKVGDIVKELQLSHRRFIELFTDQVGMTPKRYAKVLRFQRALELATARAELAWPQIALACGYFDQAHLCHDWVELTGLTPEEFMCLRKVRVKDHHVALPEPSR